ncbi:hypothetical protein [Rhodobacter sp. CZR27]|uniref:hypothetical protein n=1 Tax=Rhodobacter sp. CZR27 TaxID=2033869 RepID=UPI000BBEBFA2|nr:hypothetical protein [Rhodobacter sp. CZR27]
MLILIEAMIALVASAALFLALMAATIAPPVIWVLLIGLALALIMARRAEARGVRRPSRR